MAREDSAQLYDAAMQYHLALLSGRHISETAFGEVSKFAKDAFLDLLNANQPWLRQTAAKAKVEAINELTELYKQKIGDPSDPKFMQELVASIEARKKDRALKMAQHDISARTSIDRRLAERDAKRSKPPVRKQRRG